jgi:hypothetical protein
MNTLNNIVNGDRGVKPSKPDPASAQFVMVVYFKDGNKRYFYSYHTSYNAELKKVIVNDQISLNKLLNQLNYKFKNTYRTAIIYHKQTNRQVYKFVNDILRFNCTFIYQWINNELKIVFLD